MAEEEIVERIRAQSRQVEEALCAIVGDTARSVDDPHWVTVPLLLPTELAAIMASVTSLLEPEITWDAATQRDFLQGIYDEARRLNELVGNLLDMSRIEGGALLWMRALAWIEGFASAQITMSPGSSSLPCQRPW